MPIFLLYRKYNNNYISGESKNLEN